MVIGPDFTRVAREKDYLEIHALLNSAFGGEAEAKLVQRLRGDGDMIYEMIKPWNGKIVAYAAISKMREPKEWACLAPVAVLPEYQRSAIAPNPSQKRHYAFGSRLVREITDMFSFTLPVKHQANFPETIVVFGNPEFYGKAGFSSVRAQALKTPYSVENTLIARRGDDIPDVQLSYPKAFEKI